MEQYNIYAGLNGSFGGANYIYTINCKDINEAEEYAFEEACNIYESYEGLHGILSIEDIEDDYCIDNGVEDLTTEDYENIQEIYEEERERWLAYKVILTKDDDIKDLVLA